MNFNELKNQTGWKRSSEVIAKHALEVKSEIPEIMGRKEAYKEPAPDYEFTNSLAVLDKILRRIEDPEEKQFLILVWLRDETDLEAEAKIQEYERIYNVSAEELVHFYKSQA
jgi:hypothetical protein